MESHKIALLQVQVQPDKEAVLSRAEGLVDRAAKAGAALVVLPEIFDGRYDAPDFVPLADPLPDGKTGAMLSAAAKRNRIYLAGSVVELGDDGRAYNTGVIFDPRGEMILTHRKIHLYDVDIPGGITYKESDFFGSGDRVGVVRTELGVMGLAVCHDLRFSELFRIMALMGAEVFLVPAAFNLTSGPAHWQILLRTRAMENTVFLAACGGAPHPEVGYPYWGHSTLVDPYGEIMAQAQGREEEIVYGELQKNRLMEVRQALPVLKQRRPEVYRRFWPK